ncbi:hypothetical protein V1527DRAFT_379183, partial [Lipomyces starkeyi]
MGMIFDPVWNAIISKRCNHIVDQSMMTNHLTKVHNFKIDDKTALWATMQLYKVRPHLLVMWDESTERAMDESDDEDAHGCTKDYTMVPFRPGSAAINGIPVSDGFKCLRYEGALTNRCLRSKE